MTDWLALGGCILVVVGVALFSTPLALIVAGCIMVTIAGLISWVRARPSGPKDETE
jgi:hypothetical protein